MAKAKGYKHVVARSNRCQLGSLAHGLILIAGEREGAIDHVDGLSGIGAIGKPGALAFQVAEIVLKVFIHKQFSPAYRGGQE